VAGLTFVSLFIFYKKRMMYTAKVQLTIKASISEVWAGLTQPEWIKKYFFGSQLVTSWQPGTPIFFRGEWEGTPYEDKGTVLAYEHEKMLRFNYFSSWSDLPDLPENYQIIEYHVEKQIEGTLLTIEQSHIDTPEKRDHSVQNWENVMSGLKQLLEGRV
jgi:uncharacterized protein YndB with AHSA1/START domain